MSSSNTASEISLAELTTLLGSPHPPLLAEILGPQYYASGHLPGALNLPLEGFVAGAARLLPDKAAPIIVYCASSTCANSHIAQHKLHDLGYRNVRVFTAGKAAWRDAGRPLELPEAPPASESFVSAPG